LLDTFSVRKRLYATMHYLDANATEPLHPAAREAAMAAMEYAGNPSSIHQAGRRARRILEDAREALGGLFNTRPQDLVFTSGATEANALAVHALGAGRSILIGATEHDAIRAAAPEAVSIPVLPSGLVDPDVLESLLRAHEGALVCLMAANNETGVLHDIAAAGALCLKYNALLHVDAVQAAGRARVDWLGLGAASFAISGHKAGGPMGAGVLGLAPAVAEKLRPLIRGGGQEQGRRGGTPPLPAIAGMAAALGQAYDARIAIYRDEIAAFCEGVGAVVVGKAAPRLPNTLCLALPCVRAETQLIALDLAGIAVSAGSACSSGKVAQSHVLLAMGLGELAGQAIRVSLPWNAGPDAVAVFTAAYEAMRMRALHLEPPAISEGRKLA
jgi:cysteine desulfurase